MDTWPFEDPRNTAAITTRLVLEGKAPVLRVSHDADDGSWQLLELSDLPEGWQAWRERLGAPWRRAPTQ